MDCHLDISNLSKYASVLIANLKITIKYYSSLVIMLVIAQLFFIRILLVLLYKANKEKALQDAIVREGKKYRKTSH